MSGTATATPDKPVYAPGELMTVVVNLSAVDPQPVTDTLSGTLTLSDGTTAPWSVTLTVDAPAPTIASAPNPTDTAGKTWARTALTATTATFTATA